MATAPFKDCLITPSWHASGDVASAFNIYPSPKTFLRKRPISLSHDFSQLKHKKSKKLPPIKEIRNEKISVQIEKCGIPKLSIETIRKRYLYPFGIDSN